MPVYNKDNVTQCGLSYEVKCTVSPLLSLSTDELCLLFNLIIFIFVLSFVMKKIVYYYYYYYYSPEIYKLVKNGQGSVPFRPTLINPTLGEAEEYGDGCSSEELVTTVRRCWAEDPAERPDFHALKTIIKRINK